MISNAVNHEALLRGDGAAQAQETVTVTVTVVTVVTVGNLVPSCPFT